MYICTAHVCLFAALRPNYAVFFYLVIELFAQFDSVLIQFGIVAAARVVECYMHKHSHPLNFTKEIADLVVSNYENNRHDVLYRLTL